MLTGLQRNNHPIDYKLKTKYVFFFCVLDRASRETDARGYIQIYRKKETYCKKMTHMLMEDKITPSLQPTNWKPRMLVILVQPSLENLSPSGANSVRLGRNSKTREPGVSVSEGRRNSTP